MFANLTYKQKLLGLVVLGVLLFFAANKRSFKITKQAYNQVKQLEDKLNYVNASTTDIGETQAELSFYDKIIGKQGVEPEEIQQEILDFATQYDQVLVYNLDEIHLAESNGFSIISNQLTLEGDFNALLEVVYAFEKEFKFSNIVSVSFVKEKEYQTRKNKLRVKIIFQNYEKSN
ncbi:hypothetical protein U6A24_11190 [Aquimarina gracilis]|uniref:Uncharacterized protein n=1 Tax=Aquimarina gracilis TaxID=874422 RepID=A0ABU5ZVY3_9FLAO|nr:hypothetical protein [Aquimarina gracilis]MEB3346030.1 hypothetical protein [Aquimarina gracilis]